VGSREVELANKEFALLTALASEPHRVFTKDELLRDVWGFRSRGRKRR
jgi:DNA-binding response OmpR family regulator